MKLRILSLALCSALIACGSESNAAGGDGSMAVAGSWSQVMSSDAQGATIEFDGDSNKVLVHTAPDENGGHDHASGTYSVDAESGEVTVTCNIAGDSKDQVWKGMLKDEEMTLTLGSQTLTFKKGGHAHGDHDGHDHDDHDHEHGDHDGHDHEDHKHGDEDKKKDK